MDPDDDWALWTRSRGGDTAAFEELFRRYARTIYNYCFRRTGSWITAEDLLSVVFLEAWKQRRKELPPGKVLPWLYGIATNVIRNRQRSERRHARALSRLSEVLPGTGLAEEAAERLEDERVMKQLLEALAVLPQREQDVVVLCGWNELSYEDASVALGIPVGTVRSRLSRARARLRELELDFGHEKGDEPTKRDSITR
ncbi:MAG TPA: RNA polymerase sigma factor [Acidimicrobiales bacterium]|nr:RNA polymerase sigma factor [Acidimicrobiales bacterium]